MTGCGFASVTRAQTPWHFFLKRTRNKDRQSTPKEYHLCVILKRYKCFSYRSTPAPELNLLLDQVSWIKSYITISVGNLKMIMILVPSWGLLGKTFTLMTLKPPLQNIVWFQSSFRDAKKCWTEKENIKRLILCAHVHTQQKHCKCLGWQASYREVSKPSTVCKCTVCKSCLFTFFCE